MKEKINNYPDDPRTLGEILKRTKRKISSLREEVQRKVRQKEAIVSIYEKKEEGEHLHFNRIFDNISGYLPSYKFEYIDRDGYLCQLVATKKFYDKDSRGYRGELRTITIKKTDPMKLPPKTTEYTLKKEYRPYDGGVTTTYYLEVVGLDGKRRDLGSVDLIHGELAKILSKFDKRISEGEPKIEERYMKQRERLLENAGKLADNGDHQPDESIDRLENA